MISYFALMVNFVDDGRNKSFQSLGSMVYGMIIFASNLKIIIISNTHTLGLYLSIILSLVSYICIWMFLYNTPYFNDIDENISQFFFFFSFSIFLFCFLKINRLLFTSYFHLGNILIIGTTSLFDWAFTLYKSKIYIKK